MGVAAEQVVEQVPWSSYLPWLVLAAVIMSVLGSLFTFCVRRKRANDAVSRRKKTDERTPDDDSSNVVENGRSDDRQSAGNTTEDTRVHDVAVETIGGSGACPVISEESEVAMDTREHKEGGSPPINELEPLINEAVEEEGRSEQEVNEIGTEDVPASEETEMEPQATEQDLPHDAEDTHTQSLPNGTSDDHTHNNEVDSNSNVAMVNGGSSEVATANGGIIDVAVGNVAMVNGDDSDVAMVNSNSHEEEGRRWSFPPKLEDFDLMETDIDPAELEVIFQDERLVEIYLELDPDSPGLGISIVGGSGSPSGEDLPIVIKRVLPGSPAERDGRLKSGDELVAVDDALLVGVAKDAAIETLSNLSGTVRLLVSQDD